MLKELLSIFRADEPLASMGENFTRMLDLTLEMALAAGSVYFGEDASPEVRSRLYQEDVQVNMLERTIRKQVVAHLSVAGNSMDLPYCLLLMGLVKDVERIGDYAKNLAELVEIHPDPLPDDAIAAELREVRTRVEEMFRATSQVFAESDRERALELIQAGRDDAHRCDALVGRVARSDHGAAATTALVLGVRYYKRFGGHLLNVLSAVVMPLHQVDFFDEDPAGGTPPPRPA